MGRLAIHNTDDLLLTDHRVHQDIKPHNILIAPSLSNYSSDVTFKLADLGLAYLPPLEIKECQENRGRDVTGTQMYSR
jgi:serine/threonine protein kinase